MGLTRSLSAELYPPVLKGEGLRALLEWLLIRRLYTRPLDTLLVTWGVSLMLQQLARDVFGAPNVQTAAPDLLIVGFGTPLQEEWIAANRHRLNVKALFAMGAVMDYVTGKVSRCPVCRASSWPRCS